MGNLVLTSPWLPGQNFQDCQQNAKHIRYVMEQEEVQGVLPVGLPPRLTTQARLPGVREVLGTILDVQISRFPAVLQVQMAN